MDIDELPVAKQSRTITPTQVRYRMRLAGFPPRSFNVGGAAQVLVVSERKPITVNQIIEAAKVAACRRLAWPREDLSFRLIQPISATLPAIADDEKLTLEAEPSRPEIGPGRVQMNVTIRIEGEKRLSLPVFLEVDLVQEVARCRRQIGPNETLREADLIRDRLAVNSNQAQPPRLEALIGKRVRRSLVAGQVVAASYVQDSAVAGNATSVHAGQTVRMVFHAGAIDVVALGEAMQSGAVGQTIRVRNADSKRIVSGRVAGPKTVEIDAATP